MSVARSSSATRRACVNASSRRDVVEQRHHRLVLLVIVDDPGRSAEHHDGSVVHGVMEGRSSQNHRVDQRHRDADLGSVRKGTQHAIGGGAMEEEGVLDSGIHHREHERRTIDAEADVAQKPFIEDLVHHAVIIRSTLLLPTERGALCGDERGGVVAVLGGIGHLPIMPDDAVGSERRRRGPKALHSSTAASEGRLQGEGDSRRVASRRAAPRRRSDTSVQFLAIEAERPRVDAAESPRGLVRSARAESMGGCTSTTGPSRPRPAPGGRSSRGGCATAY